MTRLAAALVAVVALCSAAGSSVAQTSRFKGWASISKELSTRIAPKGETLDLDRFLPAEAMEDLLGSWSTFGSEHSFQNGLPNSINIAIWHATLSNFAKSIGASCSKPQLEFHPSSCRRCRSCARGRQPTRQVRRAADGVLALAYGLQRAGGRVCGLAGLFPGFLRGPAGPPKPSPHDARHHHEPLLPAAQMSPPMLPSRRDVLRFGAFGAGTLLLPRSSFPTALRRATPTRTFSCWWF
jgi:hypothetical protein